MTTRISSIEGLISIARGNQDIFRQLKIDDIYYKKSIIERYLKNNKKYRRTISSNSEQYETILSKAMQISTYELELLSVSFPLNRYRLINRLDRNNSDQNLSKKTKFTINATEITKKKLRIQFDHYKDDLTEDIVAKIEEYSKFHLIKIPSVWDLFALFFRQIIFYGKEQFVRLQQIHR